MKLNLKRALGLFMMAIPVAYYLSGCVRRGFLLNSVVWVIVLVNVWVFKIGYRAFSEKTDASTPQDHSKKY